MSNSLPAVLATWQALRETAKREFDHAGGACWSCRDTGWKASGVPCLKCAAGARAREELARRAAADYGRMLAGSGIPEAFHGRTLANFPRIGPVTRGLARYVANWDGRGLLLAGALGTGKSSLIAAVVRELAAAHGGRIRWYLAAKYLADLREAMMGGSGSGDYHELLSRGRTTRYFVLDDIGRANVGEWVSETLFMVITSRFDAGLPTFATSNYALGPDLAARLGEHGPAIVDRLGASCYGVTLTGPSMRTRLSLDIS